MSKQVWKVRLGMVAVGALLLAGGAFAQNSITVTGTAAIHGSFGMQVNLPGGQTNNAYVQDDSPNMEGRYVLDWWVSRGTLVYPNNTSIRIGAVGTEGGGQHLIFFLKKNPNNSIHMNTWYLNDTGSYNFGCTIFMSLASATVSRQFHVDFQAASAPGANNGSIDIRRVDNNNGCTITGLDNDTKLATNIRWGILSGSGNQASGEYYFDDFVSTRQ